MYKKLPFISLNSKNSIDYMEKTVIYNLNKSIKGLINIFKKIIAIITNGINKYRVKSQFVKW